MGARGRKSLVDDYLTKDGLLLLEGWSREGLTDKDIALSKIGIAESTFSGWKKKHPVIYEALKKGGAPHDYEVEGQMLASAKGFKVTLKKPMKLKTRKELKDKGTIEEEHIEYVDEEIYISPVPACQFFWLKNRRPDRWKEKPEIADTNALDKLDAILDGIKANAEKGD